MKTWIYFLKNEETDEILSTCIGTGHEDTDTIKSKLQRLAGNPDCRMIYGYMDLGSREGSPDFYYHHEDIDGLRIDYSFFHKWGS